MIYRKRGFKIIDMKKFFPFIICLLSLNLIKAAEPIEIPVWDKGNKPPTSNGISSKKEDTSGGDWVTSVAKPTLKVFPADNPNGTALLMCPGGAYYGLSMKHEGYDLAKELNSLGITLAVLKYRMPNGHHEVPTDDARQALRILRKNSDKWGIDPNRIGIGGASAGGHLASTVATHKLDDESAVNFQVLFYPVISMKDDITHKGSRENLLGKTPSEDLINYYSNELQVKSDTPRAFICATVDDSSVPVKNTFDYYDALISNGIEVDLKIYPKGGHGWMYLPEKMPYQDQWIKDLGIWLTGLYETPASDSWKGKKVAILGDSMSDPRLERVSKKRFYNYLADSMGIEPIPYAVSGYTMFDLQGMAKSLVKDHPEDIDAIIIWAGTNDYNSSVPLGTFFREDNQKTSVNGKEVWRKHKTLERTNTTFCGRINELLGYLKIFYPEKPIILLTPIHRGYAKFSTTNEQPTEEFSNQEGLFIEDYVAAIKEAGEIWSVPVIDLFGESGILPPLSSNSIFIANPDTDRLHPNDKGHKRIAKVVEKNLNRIPAIYE